MLVGVIRLKIMLEFFCKSDQIRDTGSVSNSCFGVFALMIGIFSKRLYMVCPCRVPILLDTLVEIRFLEAEGVII